MKINCYQVDQIPSTDLESVNKFVIYAFHARPVNLKHADSWLFSSYSSENREEEETRSSTLGKTRSSAGPCNSVQLLTYQFTVTLWSLSYCLTQRQFVIGPDHELCLSLRSWS